MLTIDRIRGAMLALACGDALGAPAEFKNQEYVRSRWGTLREMVGGGPWEPGEWTDDTGMALCVAEGILAEPDDPVAEIGTRFLAWRRTAKDVGGTISAALSSYRGDWAEAARSTPQARSGSAAGNGSLMRTLPVALAYPDRARMLRQSARISAMTHWDPQAEVGCALYCLWIEGLLQGDGIREAWRAALDLAREGVAAGSLSPDTPGPAPLPSPFWERLEGVESRRYEELQPGGYAGYVLDCLEAAAWCCLRAGSLEEALVLAVNLAGEADTIAAVAGGAAGAFWGAGAVPERWLEKLHERERVERTAERLAGLRRHHEIYARDWPPPFAHFQVIERIYAGRNPLSARDVEALAGRGITHVLDLREPHEWTSTPERPRFGQEALDALWSFGIVRRHLPMRDGHAPEPEQLAAACGFLADTLADPEARVYVHCRGGKERTASVLLAYWMRRESVSLPEALERLRAGCPLLDPLGPQRRAVEAWLASGR